MPTVDHRSVWLTLGAASGELPAALTEHHHAVTWSKQSPVEGFAELQLPFGKLTWKWIVITFFVRKPLETTYQWRFAIDMLDGWWCEIRVVGGCCGSSASLGG